MLFWTSISFCSPLSARLSVWHPASLSFSDLSTTFLQSAFACRPERRVDVVVPVEGAFREAGDVLCFDGGCVEVRGTVVGSRVALDVGSVVDVSIDDGEHAGAVDIAGKIRLVCSGLGDGLES